MPILFAVLLFPFLELLLLLRMAATLGFAKSVIWLLLAAVVGMFLLKKTRSDDPAFLIKKLAGALLLIPGPLTDILAVFLLIPAVRKKMAAQTHFSGAGFQGVRFRGSFGRSNQGRQSTSQDAPDSKPIQPLRPKGRIIDTHRVNPSEDVNEIT